MMISGALRTLCSLAPPPFGTLMVNFHHFVPHAGRVIKAFSHLQASLQREKPFDPDIKMC